MFTTTLMGHWISLTWLTLGVNYVLGGMALWGYYLGNLLLHAANAVVFYAVARRLLAAGFSVGPAERAVAWGAAAAVRQGATVTGCAAHGLGARVAMTLYSLMFYPSKFLWPVELSPMYELPARVEPLAWRFLLPMVAVPAGHGRAAPAEAAMAGGSWRGSIRRS